MSNFSLSFFVKSDKNKAIFLLKFNENSYLAQEGRQCKCAFAGISTE